MSEQLVDVELLRSTTQADVWANEFEKVRPEVDWGLMVGWFANAIECGRAAGREEGKAEASALLDIAEQ